MSDRLAGITFKDYVPTPTCGATRGRGKVQCEQPPEHLKWIGDSFWAWHRGRGRDGRWLQWKEQG